MFNGQEEREMISKASRTAESSRLRGLDKCEPGKITEARQAKRWKGKEEETETKLGLLENLGLAFLTKTEIQ